MTDEEALAILNTAKTKAEWKGMAEKLGVCRALIEADKEHDVDDDASEAGDWDSANEGTSEAAVDDQCQP